MTNVKILYLITKSNFGGAQRYVYDLAYFGKNREHEVLVGLGGSGPLKTKLEEAGIPVVSFGNLGRDVSFASDLRSAFEIWKLIRKERPDIIHSNSSKMGGIGSLIGRISNGVEHVHNLFTKSGRPALIIFTGHGWAFNESRNDLERLVIGFFHWITIMLAHKTIAVSNKTLEQIAALPIPYSRLHCIHNGIGEIPFSSREEARTEIFRNTPWELMQFPKNHLLIGTLAELHPNKGVRYAIDGMALLTKQFPEIFYVVLGTGELRKQLEGRVSELSLTEHVLLAGERENAARLLSAFDIFLLPSITEAFPYAILEAGKAGLPIIASSVGGIPEVIDDMESGILIHSKNSNEIARAIRYLATERARRKELARAIAKRIKDRFSLSEMTERTFALYRHE